MPKEKTKQVKVDAVPIPSVTSEQSGEQKDWKPSGDKEEKQPLYVVVRSGIRVSDLYYTDAKDEKAIAEKEFWQRIVTRFPDGTKIEIVTYDKKKHRVW